MERSEYDWDQHELCEGFFFAKIVHHNIQEEEDIIYETFLWFWIVGFQLYQTYWIKRRRYRIYKSMDNRVALKWEIVG